MGQMRGRAAMKTENGVGEEEQKPPKSCRKDEREIMFTC